MDESPDNLAVLRNINVSRPQLERPASRRSVAARTEQAFTSRPVTMTTDGGSITPPLHQIPHHHGHSGIHSHDGVGDETFLPSTHTVLDRLQDGAREGEGPHLTRIESNPVRRKPLSRPTSSRYSGGARYSQLNPDVGATTPEADDGPYLRFAIDQLTRDEEVRGSRQYPTHDRWTTADSVPVRTTVEPLPVPSQDVINRGLRATRQLIAEPPIIPATQVAQPMLLTTELDVVERAPPPPQPVRYVETQTTTALPPAPDLFAYQEDHSHKLKFLPAILRPLCLLLFILAVLLMLAALIFSGAWSGLHLGILAYTAFGGPRWFLFKYLPTLLGMILLLWLFQIQIALQRVAPYIAMASSSKKSRSEAPLMEVQPTNFILPKLFYFRAGQPVVGIVMFIFWLQIFTVPLLSTLFNVFAYTNPVNGWRWAAVQGIVWTLVGLYFLLLVALILLALWLWRQRTGLKWDPRSLAELIALLDRSNITKHYDNSEAFRTPKDFRERLHNRSDRLGFWSTSRRPAEVFYAIGEDDGEVAHHGSIGNREKLSTTDDRGRYSYDGERRDGTPLDTDDLDSIMHRYLPWYLRTPFTILWCVLGILLFVAFLVVSFVNRAVLSGFKPALTTQANSAAFSATNFFYAFIPALIAQILFLCWMSVDYAFRRLEPYVAMSAYDHDGAAAQNSLLLDYPYRFPFLVTFSAVLGRHFLVAWFSLVTLIAAAIPVLAGGCFWSQFYIATQTVEVTVNPAGFFCLCVFVGLVAISLPLVLIGARKRRLPHAVTTLAEQFSFLYASHILGERADTRAATNKLETNTRLLGSTTDRERELHGGRFTFGRFVGRDGHPHIGIERVGRINGKTPSERSGWRDSRTQDESPQMATPYHEEKIEETALLPQRSATDRGYAAVPVPVPAQLPIRQGPAPGMADAPIVASSFEVTRPGYYNPYARLATTGPSGFPVGRELPM